MNLTASGVVREVIENNAIMALGDDGGFDYQTLYDQANQNKLQYKLNGFAAWYFPIYHTIVGKINYQGGYIHGKNLFQNELFQIGGFHSFRGFDENSFYANQYHILTGEIHFIFGQDNYFYLFSDNGYVQTRFAGFSQSQFPYSFGVGINLANKTGIFSLALGVGKRDGEPMGFKNAKVHFGYAAYF